ncbi:LysR substrate-binding domain-containing protein [Paraburkholderia sp. MM5384-R2]|uniref:LysR substrate-binding domain-containing protein n=1 Tax=Paraburkholderia sp. MM5384-R2 TaxID=2723097 RepID=UPI0039062E78
MCCPNRVAPAFRRALDAFFLNAGVEKVPDCESETLLSIFSMVASKGFCSLVPSHFASVLPKSVVGRTLNGQRLNLDLVLAYPEDNVSPALNSVLRRWNLQCLR